MTVRLAALLTLTMLTPRPGMSQTGCAASTCTVEVTIPVADVIRISLSTGSANLGAPSLNDFAAGYRDIAGPAVSVVVKANRAFQVQVTGATAEFSYVGSLANPLKPASDLKWSTSQAGLATTTNNMGTTATFMSGTATSSAAKSAYLRTAWAFSRDVPGTYSLTVSFTLSAP